MTILGTILTACWCGVLPAVQVQPDRTVSEDASAGGLWPTDTMVRLLVLRWCDEVVDRYEVDDAHAEKLRDQMVDRWSQFAYNNEEKIRPVINEWIEMRLGMEPPGKERVAAWSKKATSAFEAFEKQIDEGAPDLRELLPPDQRGKFDGDLLGFQTGIKFAKGKLAQWSRGEFTEREFWDPPRSVYRERQAEREREQAQENEVAQRSQEPKDQITEEMDAWQQYVEDFIREYALDESQKKTALSILKELRERALSHRDKHKFEIDRLEKRIHDNKGTDEELKDIEAELVELYGPIDEMFKELQRRLDPIPTAAQRAAADDREDDSPPPSPDKKPSDPA